MDQRGSSHSSAGKKQSHKAKSTSEWKKRLRRFAAGEKFRRGERPPKGSHWDDVISKIVACPAHQRDDRPYNCQYHPSVSSFITQKLSCLYNCVFIIYMCYRP